jgi:hypothetical protein
MGLGTVLFFSGLIYLALKLLYIQVVSEEGIYKIYFSQRKFIFQADLLPWSDIYDYYIQKDEFFSTVSFIMRDGKLHIIQVPTYLVKILAKLADYSIDKYAFLMRYGKKTSKSSSQT